MKIHRTTNKSIVVSYRYLPVEGEEAFRLIVSGVVSLCEYCSVPRQDVYHEPCRLFEQAFI